MLSPSLRQVTHALLTRPPLSFRRSKLPLSSVRLACIKHTASVRPEPGSNSLWHIITEIDLSVLDLLLFSLLPSGKYCQCVKNFRFLHILVFLKVYCSFEPTLHILFNFQRPSLPLISSGFRDSFIIISLFYLSVKLFFIFFLILWIFYILHSSLPLELCISTTYIHLKIRSTELYNNTPVFTVLFLKLLKNSTTFLSKLLAFKCSSKKTLGEKKEGCISW